MRHVFIHVQQLSFAIVLLQHLRFLFLVKRTPLASKVRCVGLALLICSPHMRCGPTYVLIIHVVHAWERNKPWLEGTHAYMVSWPWPVYVHVSGYYFVNTNYVETTRQSARRSAARLGEWSVTFYRPGLWCKRMADTLPPGSVCLSAARR